MTEDNDVRQGSLDWVRDARHARAVARNSEAGTLQATGFAPRLKRVPAYIDALPAAL